MIKISKKLIFIKKVDTFWLFHSISNNFGKFWYKFNLFWLNLSFSIIFVANLIDFVATIKNPDPNLSWIFDWNPRGLWINLIKTSSRLHRLSLVAAHLFLCRENIGGPFFKIQFFGQLLCNLILPLFLHVIFIAQVFSICPDQSRVCFGPFISSSK